MIHGRLVGIFVAVILAYYLKSDNIIGTLGIWLFATIVGFFASVIVSLYLGININTEQPTTKDGLDYWTEKYGPVTGKEFYELWLKTIK